MAVTRANLEYLDTNGSPTQRATQQATQLDDSGLEEVEIADVACILHPCSLAAYQVVVNTAMRSPQHVLQNVTPSTYSDGLSIADLEKEETFLAADVDSRHPLDLALRLSARTVNPTMGFVFGRNPAVCDVVIDTDTVKRVSNVHFRIYMTDAGVCMLHDMSTNGTLVDDKLLRGRGNNRPATMMLTAGSVIQILSTKRDESLKFIFRLPSRENHFNEWATRFASYWERVNLEALKQQGANQEQIQAHQGTRTATKSQWAKPAPSVNPLLMQQNPYGMHWNGGNKYNVTGHLGKGAFATVYRLNTKVDGQLFAVKELEKRRFMKNGIMDKKLDNELQIMREINHPHVVQYVDYHDVKNHLYIIMELVPFGDLQQWLGANGPLPEDLAKPMASQIFDALAYLHRKMITHRDIKPDNILIADSNPQSFTVKISDFGLSKVVSDNETFLKTFCGTLLYCAPEVFPHYDAHVNGKGRKRDRKGTTAQRRYHCYSHSVDIWSLGGVLWYALTTKPPFEGVADHTGKAMFERIISTPLDTSVLVKRGISNEAIDLLQDMLNTDPSSRPSALQCLTYTWLGGNSSGETEIEQDAGLNTIEEEAETGAAPDLSQLSIHGRQNQGKLASHDSSDLEYSDPRQSKRFKSGQLASQQVLQSRQLANPPPSMHAAADLGARELAPNQQPTPLFGEVQQSLLQSSGVFGTHAQPPVFAREVPNMDSSYEIGEDAHRDLFTSAATHQPNTDAKIDEQLKAPTDDPPTLRSASLEGAESDMRDFHMYSSRSGLSFTADPSEPQTPKTPESPPRASVGQAEGGLEETPRPAIGKLPSSSFNRQISLPLSASSFYDPNDPNTHSAEYASSISGYDFTNHNLLPGLSFHSLPPTTANSANLDIEAVFEQAVPLVPQSQPEFIRPAPRLGRLTTTPDSFADITLDLSSRITTWGRSPLNTFVFPSPLDTRIPKRGIVLFFHVKGIEKLEKTSEDWTKLPGLHCLIATDSSNGIFINGMKLNAKDAQGRQLYGRVYTGDEVTVCQGNKGGLLRFICTFNHGEAKEKRPEFGPRFEVENMMD